MKTSLILCYRLLCSEGEAISARTWKAHIGAVSAKVWCLSCPHVCSHMKCLTELLKPKIRTRCSDILKGFLRASLVHAQRPPRRVISQLSLITWLAGTSMYNVRKGIVAHGVLQTQQNFNDLPVTWGDEETLASLWERLTAEVQIQVDASHDIFTGSGGSGGSGAASSK